MPNILIGDDDEELTQLLQEYLDNHGIRCDCVHDGAAVIQRLKAVAHEDTVYDLLVLDIMMPKLSGFEVCQQLKADPTTRQIMVLMVTALGELGDIERAVEAGTDDFLSKPVNKIELVKRVENMLKLRHVSDELQRLRSYISSMDNDLPPRQAQS